MRVFLIGFMGAGKTTIGNCLASALGYPFIDLDAVVEEQAGLSVATIFQRFGEDSFRRRETACLRETAQRDSLVVATGGGTFTFEANRALIHRLGISMWLDPSFETIEARIGPAGRRNRPLYGSSAEMQALYNRRAEHYRLANYRVPIDLRDRPAGVAARAERLLREHCCDI